MFNNIQLTEGALEGIMNGSILSNPIVQILGSKQIGPSGVSGNDRYRLLLSDGKYKINVAMFTFPKNIVVPTSVLELYSIIKIKHYTTNVIPSKGVKDTRVLIILELESIENGKNIGTILGNPKLLSDDLNQTSQSSEISIMEKGNFVLKTFPHANNIASPIAILNPFHNNWIIKARCINKGKIRNWSNARGEGKLFTVEFADHSGEIRCTAFTDVVDLFYELLEVDKVYFVSKSLLKPSNPQFSSLKHPFEMTLIEETKIEESTENNELVPEISFKFTSLDKVIHLPAGSLIDIIGVCTSVSEIDIFTSKSTNRELKKREVLLVDQSLSAVSLTLWGYDADLFTTPENSIIVLKNAKVNEFQTFKSLVVTSETQIRVEPNIPEKHYLKRWYDKEGYQMEFQNLNSRPSAYNQCPWKTLKEITQDSFSDNNGYFQVYATVLLIRQERAIYKSCPSPNCQKKITDLENGMYRCEKCNREFDSFKYGLLLSMNIADSTSNAWATAFSSAAENIIGKSAQEIGELMENDSDSSSKLFENAQFKQFLFKCKVKMDTYNDDQKLRILVLSVAPFNFEDNNKHLFGKIQKFRGTVQ